MGSHMRKVVCAKCVVLMVNWNVHAATLIEVNGERVLPPACVQTLCQSIMDGSVVVVNKRRMHTAVSTYKGADMCASCLYEEISKPEIFP